MDIKNWVNSGYVYQCRVKAAEVFELSRYHWNSMQAVLLKVLTSSRYEYWWGRQKGWKSEPLATFTAETAVLWMSGQGQVVWNEYLKCYVFVRLGKLGGDARSYHGGWHE